MAKLFWNQFYNLQDLIDSMRWRLAALRCRLWGHKMMSESWYPEEGHEIIWCTRCGIEHEVWWG